MTRRLLVLALSAGITAAPLALTLCQVLCADAPSRAAQHHSCHSDVAPGSLTVTGVPHACGHSSESPDAVAGASPSPTVFAAVLPVVAWTGLVRSFRAVAADPVESPPRGSPPSITQLRV